MIAEQLKKSILQVALQGKLTKQLPEDGDSNDLLKEIQKEKTKNKTQLSEITEDEFPFDIPKNWKWCYLESISMKIHYGFTASAEMVGNSKMLRITDIQDNTVNWDTVPYCQISESIIESYILQNRDIVIARTGGTIGKTYIVRNLSERAVFASYLIRVIPSKRVCEEYLKYFMESDLYWKQLIDKSQGTGQPNVNGKSLSRLILPLPPINEQKRIVDRIEELFPSINELRYDENKLDSLQKSFPKKLKDSILEYAIQGKLTEQLLEDGDARSLMKDLQKEKARLIKEGTIKKGKSLPEITEDEIPYDIPGNWRWVRLDDIGEIVGGGTPRTENQLNWLDGNIPWLTPADMKNINGKNVENGERYITEYGLKNSSAQLMPKGTVLFSSRAPIGYLAIASNSIATNQGFKSIVPYTNEMSEYIYYYLMAYTSEIKKMGSGTTFMEVSGSVMKKLLIPVPPLEEQRRIVAKLEDILPYCDNMY